MTSANPFVEKMVAVRGEAIKLLMVHGLWDKGWRFLFSNHYTIVGQCDYEKQAIKYSQHFLLKTPHDEITDTLLHEIAHALVGPGHGHGITWRRKAREVGARPERTCGPEAVSTKKYNYVIKCEGCGREWKRYRMRRSNHGARCTNCGTTVKIYKYVRQ